MNDRDTVGVLREKASRHKKLSETYTNAANAIETALNSLIEVDDGIKTSNKTYDRGSKSGITFESALNMIFNDGKPRTSRELFNDFNREYGMGAKKYGSFSGQLSTLITRKGVVLKHEIKGNPLSNRYFYGLSDWFNNGVLKSEYLNKIK